MQATQYPPLEGTQAVPQQQQQFNIQQYEQQNQQYRQEIADLVLRNQKLATEFREKTDQIQKTMEAKLALFLPILKNGGDLGANLMASVEESNRLKSELMQKNQYIGQLENQNASAQKEIQRLNMVVSQTQAAFENQKKNDQQAIFRLGQQISGHEQTIRNAENEINSLRSDLQTQKQKVSKFTTEISSLKNELKNAQASQGSNKLRPDESLNQGESLVSKSGAFKAIMQEDANFVVYDQNKNPVWSSDSYKTHVSGPYHLRMQADGNLVIYGWNNQVVWASDTFQKGAGGSSLVLQDKGRLVIKDKHDHEQWST